MIAFGLNLAFGLDNVANDFFSPITSAMGFVPTYMRDTPSGSGSLAKSAALLGTMAGMVVGPAGDEGVVAAGTKAAVREALEKGAISESQRAAVRSALNRAGSNATFVVEKLSDGSLRVLTRRAGDIGNQVIEKIIDAGGSTISVIQRAYNEAGNLIHLDPKFP